MIKSTLIAQNIHKHFPGVHAVNDVSATFQTGQVVAVIGENGAGKSTLMRIIAGVHQPDSGEILVDEKPVVISSVSEATELGISFIHQELNLADNLSIAANLFLGREAKRFQPFNWIDSAAIDRQSETILSRLSLDLSPHQLVRTLSIGQQQMIEIGKSLSQSARLIIMDEPTSSLTKHETQRLFDLIRELKEQDVGIVYISHRLMEVSEIADRVIVLRDGQNSGELIKPEIEHHRMVSLMVGRESTQFYQLETRSIGEDRFRAEDLVVPKLNGDPINFSLKAGEVVGMAGLVGAGRTELAESIFGIRQPISGLIHVDQQSIKTGSPAEAINAGIFLVPEDRRLHGLITEFSVRDNITLPGINHYQTAKFIQGEKTELISKQVVNELRIKTPSIEQAASLLSGGNQQKIVLGKWMSLKPKVLLLDEPTRGVDVMSKGEIYQLIDDMAKMGIAILAISSDLEEILRISDRVLVMHKGNLAGQLDRAQVNEEAIMKLATGTT